MNPITQVLVAVALDRAGLRRISRMAMPILVLSGVAADLDLVSYFGGANAYLHYRCAVLHSIVGAPILAVLMALAFWQASRRNQAALRFSRVLLLCVIGIGVHILLDVTTADGVQLLWPFRVRWFSLDLLSGVDPWILAVLAAGLLVPALFHLVSEEIGSKKKSQRPSKGAIAVAGDCRALYGSARRDARHGVANASGAGLPWRDAARRRSVSRFRVALFVARRDRYEEYDRSGGCAGWRQRRIRRQLEPDALQAGESRPRSTGLATRHWRKSLFATRDFRSRTWKTRPMAIA